MGESVGQIGLDLVVNEGSFKRQMAGISGLAKKAGMALAAAFSVKKLVDFGKECINLGSDLAEVQNVVDVTFPNMTAQVDKFAKSALTSFGLSETMAKQYTGTFGAMAKAFGFSEQAAYEMGTTLTGLAGDVASFYNISQDEAYTKLKSVFSGETETLKDLGVVMTQSALDAYALANGYGKTTANMSELEKVSLRYAFVQDQLTAATGDFARTSDSWANQVRIMKLQMQSFMATVGQGLINLFTPIIKIINIVIGKLMTLANAFKKFTELITGKKSAGDQAVSMGKQAADSLNSASGAADGLKDSTTSAGKAAKKAAKEMRSLMGFDVINKLDKESASTDSSSGGSGAGGTAIDFGSLSEGDSAIGKTDKACSKLVNRLNELASLCKKGFLIGFGDSQKNIDKIKKSVSSIRTSITDIFTSSDISSAIKKFTDSAALNLGKIAGATANVGIAIVTNLTSGIAKSLEEKKSYIQEKIASILTISADSFNLVGDFATTIGDLISSAFTSDAGIDISSDICSILTTGVLGGAELFAKASLDISSVIIQPFIDNKDKISKAIQGTLKPISDIIGTIKDGVEDAFEIIGKAYDEHISPMFKTFKEGISDTFGKLLDAYNTYVAPALQSLADKFSEVYDQHIKPCMEKIGETIGIIADVISDMYTGVVKPVIDWLIENLVPVLVPILEALGKNVLTIIGTIADVVGSLLDIFKGIIEFLRGVFTQDWKRALNGLKTIFKGVIDFFGSLLKGWLDMFKNAWEGIKKVFAPITGWFEEKFRAAYKGIKSVFKGIGKWFKARYDDVTGVFAGIGGWFKNKFDEAWKGMTGAFKNVSSFFKGLWNKISKCFTNVGTKIGSAVGGAFKTSINAVFKTIENIVNGFIKTINGTIKIINKIPGVSIGKISTVKLPRLAQGGYVKPNTPQLAMIGDNRHQGEVVAPEDKLREMAAEAARMAGGNSAYSAEILKVLLQILDALNGMNLELSIDGKKLKDVIVKKINQNTIATGVCEIIT